MATERIVIRQAEPRDAEFIAEIKVAGWQTAYEGIVDGGYLRSLSAAHQTELFKNTYSLKTIFVAEADGEMVGFCRFCRYDTAVYEDIDCEIREIYVKPNRKRMGIGSQLFRYTLDHLKRNGKRKLYLGCFAENVNARRFYEKWGGTPKGKAAMEINGKEYEIQSYIFNLNELRLN